ncbi:hypothetical protein EG829_17220 [bacterium]|nr:hypothetical protein [bacterium]
MAQEALSHVEEKVYDLLWGVKNQSRDSYRLADFSLQRIANEARINIKTVRELLPRLADKGFIALEREADVRRNLPTRYRVWSYGEVLADQQRRNRLWVVKTGKGVFYAKPVSVGLAPDTEQISEAKRENQLRPMGDEAGTVGGGQSPVGLGVKPPGVSKRPVGVKANPSALLSSLARLVRDGLGLVADEALLTSMVEECHLRSMQTTGSPATEEEIVHFSALKIRVLVRATNLRNPLGVLRRAVPECFSGQPFLEYRLAELQRGEREVEELRGYDERVDTQSEDERLYELQRTLREGVSGRHRTEFGYDLKAISEDPELDGQGREIARERLKRLGRYAPHGL